MSAKPLTGRKVFIITASAFAIIIGVNFYMARQAVSTFPGLVTEDSYSRSQEFDADRAAQVALGWEVEADIEDGQLMLTIADDSGAFPEPQNLEVVLGRAATDREDVMPEFVLENGVLVASVNLEGGMWKLWINATSADGIQFRREIELYVGS